MYILQTYVMIPSNIAYFVLGIVFTIIALIVIGVIASKKQEKKKQEITDKFIKELSKSVNEKDKK